MTQRKPKRPKSKGNRKPRSTFRRNRDHKAEYARRIALALSKGKSISEGRGHARAGERSLPRGPRLIKASLPEEKALRLIKSGQSIRAAAKAEGVTEERLRRHMKENTTAVHVGKVWKIEDTRPRQYPLYSTEGMVSPWLSVEEASKAAKFMTAAIAFIGTGKDALLEPFLGEGATDIRGRRHLFETDFNRLYELASAGELDLPNSTRSSQEI